MKGVLIAWAAKYLIIVLCSQSIIMPDLISSHIRIVSYNTRGLRNLTIPSLFNDYDIILLQETLLCKQDLVSLNSLSPEFQGTGVSVTDLSVGLLKGRPSGGIGVLWRKTLGSIVTEMDFKLNWLSGICIKVPNGDNIFIISAISHFNVVRTKKNFSWN